MNQKEFFAAQFVQICPFSFSIFTKMEKESEVWNFTKRQGGIIMSQEQMKNEIMYRLSVQALDSFLRQGIITVDEYHRIDKLNREKFMPFFATIIG